MGEPAVRWRAGRAAAIALLAGAALAAGQDEPPPAGSFGERVDVEVVEVDVVVTGRDGRHVLDLGRRDFAVLVDGEPVEIAYFTPPRAGAEPGAEPRPEAAPAVAETTWDGEVEEAPAPGSTLVVYVDQAALRVAERRRALIEIREFLARRVPGETVAIAAFEDRLRLLAPPSAEPAAIERALDALEELPIAAELAHLEARELDNRIRGIGIRWPRGENQGQQFADLWEQDGSGLEREVRQWAELETARYRRSIAALTQLVGAFAALDGRKSVVLVTGGTTTASGESMLELLAAQRGNAKANRLTGDIEARDRLRREFEDLVQAAQDARVALYTVSAADPRANLASAELASPGRDTPTGQRQDPAIADAAAGVARLAGATGGGTLLLASDLDERLERVRADADAAYSLGIATGPEAGERDHRIEVRVAREGVRVRHREGFRRRPPGAVAELSLFAAATLGEERNALGVAVEAGEARPAEGVPGDRLVPLAVRIPLRALALEDGEGGRRRARLGLRVAIETASGELLLAESQRVPIEVPVTELERALAGVWVHRTEVRVTPEARRLAVLVVDEITGASATATIAVTASPAGGDRSR
jgi:VWFA-related protein